MELSNAICVVIPAYNAAAFLAETVLSVLASRDVTVRIVIVDDGSQDGTVRIARQLQEHHDNIVLISQPNSGVSSARNAGLDQSCRYVCFLDADDLLAPDGLRQLLQSLQTNDNAVATYGKVGYLTGTGERTSASKLHDRQSGDVGMSVLCSNLIDTPGAVLFSTEAILKVGGFLPGVRIGEDWNIYARIAQLGPVLFVDKTVMWYRLHEGSVMSRRQLSLLDFQPALDATYNCVLIQSKYPCHMLSKFRLRREIGITTYLIQRSMKISHVVRNIVNLVLNKGFVSNGGLKEGAFWKMMLISIKKCWKVCFYL